VIVRAEFTIYPFMEGEALPPYVQAGIDAILAMDIAVDVGPLSNTISGEVDRVLDALRGAGFAAMASGATRIVVSLEAVS
jgi:uncharacterized protein YqgV (UPF0045/DUF77 family)